MGLTGKNDRANVTLFAQEHSRASTGSHRTKSDCQFEIKSIYRQRIQLVDLNFYLATE